MDKRDALNQLETITTDPRQDFDTLTSSQVDRVLELAKSHRYQKPRSANGSRARYYYARLQRAAKIWGETKTA